MALINPYAKKNSFVAGSILKATCEQDFSLRALQDYAQAKADKYQSLLGAIELIVSEVPSDVDSAEDITSDDQLIQDTIASLTNNGDQLLLLNNGWVRLSDYLTAIYNKTLHTFEDDIDETLSDDLMEVKDGFGNVVGVTNFYDSVASIKEGLHSTIVLAGSCAAMSASTVAEKITIFRDHLSQTFGSAYQDISSSANSYLEIVKSAVTPSDFLSSMATFLGIDKEESDDIIPENTLVYEYTGSSPLGALCWDNIGAAAASTGKIMLNVFVASWKAIFSAVKNVFSFVGEKVNRLVGDPYDLSVLHDDSQSHSIDGFCWKTQDELSFSIFSGQAGQGNQYDVEVQQAIRDELNKSFGVKDVNGIWKLDDNDTLNRYYITKTIGGDIMTRVTSLPSTLPTTGLYIDYAFTTQFKPKALNFKVTDPLLSKYFKLMFNNVTKRIYLETRPGFTYNDLCVDLQELHSKENLKLDEKANEGDLYTSFINGAVFTNIFGTLCSKVLGAGGAEINMTDNILNVDYTLAYVPLAGYESGEITQFPPSQVFQYSTATNADFLSIASCYDSTTQQFNRHISTFCNAYFPDIQDSSITDYDPMDLNSDSLLKWYPRLILYHFMEKVSFPYDYGFVPYRYGSESWDLARFAIKTDAENSIVFQKFMELVAIATVIAVVAFTASKIFKRVFFKLRERRERILSEAKLALGNKKPLSRKQQRVLAREWRKSSVVNKVQAGLLGASVSDDNESDQISSIIESISNLIRD